jgi:putative endonuclease
MPYYVYLLASCKHGALYLGLTTDLVRDIFEYKNPNQQPVYLA